MSAANPNKKNATPIINGSFHLRFTYSRPCILLNTQNPVVRGGKECNAANQERTPRPDEKFTFAQLQRAQAMLVARAGL